MVGHDHLGHGASVASEEELGYFAEPDPSDTLVEDMHTLRTTIQTENPGVPYFMMGHSMGSYMPVSYTHLSIGMIFPFYSSSCKRGWLLKVTIRFFAAGFGRADAHISSGTGI